MPEQVRIAKLPPSPLLQMHSTHLLSASLSAIEAEEGVPALGLLAATTAATAAPAAAPAAAPPGATEAGRTGAFRAWGGSARLNDMLPKGRRPDVSRVSTSPPYEFNVGSEPGKPLPAGPLPRDRRRRHTKMPAAARAAGARGCNIASVFFHAQVPCRRTSWCIHIPDKPSARHPQPVQCSRTCHARHNSHHYSRCSASAAAAAAAAAACSAVLRIGWARAGRRAGGGGGQGQVAPQAALWIHQHHKVSQCRHGCE